MHAHKFYQKILVFFVLLLLLAAGCKNSPSPILHSVFPVGRLIAGQTCTLKIICNVEAAKGAVARVTADLSLLGGAADQSLTEMPDGTWRWAGDVHPPEKGLTKLTVIAIDSVNLQTAVTKKIRVHVPGKAIAVAGGFGHTLVLKADGTVACWGRNTEGECDIPAGLSDVVAIAAEGQFSFALKFDGTVACWGGGSESYYCPYTEDMSDVITITGRAVALKANGTIIDKDCDFYDDCEISENLQNVVTVANGFGQRLAVKSNGTVACWGKKDDGECDVPLGLHNVVAVAGGYLHSLALKENGGVVAWGGRRGQPVRHRMVPLGLGRLISIAAQGNESRTVNVGLRQDGTVVVWSKYPDGWLFRVSSGLEGSIAIASGWYHYLALGEDGGVTAWGDNQYGQCDVPEELQ